MNAFPPSPKASYGPPTAANSYADSTHDPRWTNIRDSLSIVERTEATVWSTESLRITTASALCNAGRLKTVFGATPPRLRTL